MTLMLCCVFGKYLYAFGEWRGCGVSWGVTDLCVELIDLCAEVFVFFHAIIDGSDGVHDGGVVTTAEVAADFFEGEAGAFACEEHADLARFGDGLMTTT